MLLFSKLSNLIFTLSVALLLVSLVLLSILLYTTRSIVQDRERVKEIVKTENIRDAYRKHLTENSTSPIEVSQEQLGEIEDNEIDISIDKTIDAIYDWMEGKSPSPSIAITAKEAEADPLGLEEVAHERIGVLADFINYEELNKAIDEEVSLIDLQSDQAEYMPKIYQGLNKWNRNSLILTVLLSAVLIISASNLRQGVLILGISYLIAAAILSIGPGYIQNNHSSIDITQIPFIKLPDPGELSKFSQELIIEIGYEVKESVQIYGKYLIATSVLIIVLSQIAIRRREIDDDDDEYTPTRRFEQDDLAKLNPKASSR